MVASLRTPETVSPQVVALLSRITGKKLESHDVTPPVLFLTALIAVLLGVMLADQTLTDEEKKRWQKTINYFIPKEGNIRELTILLSKGIREQKIYKNLNELLVLTESLSEPEKLLLISFGYEMSAADGSIDESERNYLRLLTNHLGVVFAYSEILEFAFIRKPITDLSLLAEVRFLLDPSRFQELDTLFVSAASNLLEKLPSTANEQKTTQKQAVSYRELEKFQQSRQALDRLCYELYQVIQGCVERGFLPNTLIDDVSKLSQKLQSRKFRVAVLGEFSQGKSTLLNALLGEKIQPVRAIPCSGTVSVLRYGRQKRVICHYKNGQKEEVSLEKYQEIATIPKHIAMGEKGDESLLQNEIYEVILEHPDLELCRNGVEIVDSPGLNEHPDRTAITLQLLKETDAAIFLTSATRQLTQSERELLQDLKVRLNNGNPNLPAHNLFIAVNFFDLVEEEEDRHDIQQRLQSFLYGDIPLITGENRIHYISAKAALNSFSQGQTDAHSQSFRQFTQALEYFLTSERGSIEIEQVVNQLQQVVQLSLLEIKQVGTDINLSESERQQILEQIGEASGRDVKIQIFADDLIEEVIAQAIDSFEAWNENLQEKILAQSKEWHSDYSHLWDQKRLVADYANQFAMAVQKELDLWGSEQLQAKILNPALEKLEKNIREELAALQYNSTHLSQDITARFGDQLKLIIKGISDDFSGAGGFLGGGAAGIALAAGLYAFTFIAIIPIIIAAVAAAVFGSFGLGLLDVDGIHDKIKAEVLAKGFEKFDESLEKVYERLGEVIQAAFSTRLDATNEAIQQIIACYENALQVNENNNRFSLEELKINRVWIGQKQQELEQIQQRLETILKPAAE